MLLILMLVVILMGSAAYYLWGRAEVEEAQRPGRGRQTPSEGEVALPLPERPVESPPQPLGLGLGGGGAFFDSDWDDDDEAATEVAVMPSTPAPAPMRSGLAPMMSFGAIEDADEQATEVMDANSNAELAAALRAVQEEEIPSFGDRGGAYFDDDWDDDEAPTAVMTGDMADKYADMLLDASDDDDDEPAGPGRVVAKKD